MALALADGGGRTQDEAGARAAAQRLTEIGAALAGLRQGGEFRTRHARQTGQEIATGLSLISLLAGAVWVALRG